MEGYSAKIIEASKELTAKEKVMMKDKSGAISIDKACGDDGETLTIKPIGYVVLEIHNEKADRKDYENYILIAEDGKRYVTGSPSFWNAFKDIWSEMADVDEDWELECYKLDSNNYKGKKFLTCSIV